MQMKERCPAHPHTYLASILRQNHPRISRTAPDSSAPWICNHNLQPPPNNQNAPNVQSPVMPHVPNQQQQPPQPRLPPTTPQQRRCRNSASQRSCLSHPACRLLATYFSDTVPFPALLSGRPDITSYIRSISGHQHTFLHMWISCAEMPNRHPLNHHLGSGR